MSDDTEGDDFDISASDKITLAVFLGLFFGMIYALANLGWVMLALTASVAIVITIYYPERYADLLVEAESAYVAIMNPSTDAQAFATLLVLWLGISAVFIYFRGQSAREAMEDELTFDSDAQEDDLT